MKKVRNAFVTGLLVFVPVMATVDIVLWAVRSIDNSIRAYFPSGVPLLEIRGSGLVLGLILILVVGSLTHNYLGEWFVGVLDSTIRKIPLGGGIYSGIKKFLETILNPKSDQFKEAVLVQFPREGVYSIGFRTGVPDPKISQHSKEKLANVFVPCTPNPTSGFYLLVPESSLIPLKLPVPEAFKIVISMGIVTSDETIK